MGYLTERTKLTLRSKIEDLTWEKYLSAKKTNPQSMGEIAYILKASNDLGVQLNGGRRGAQWGPQGIIHQFSKMTAPSSTALSLAQVIETCEPESFEGADGVPFHEAQSKECEKWSQFFEQASSLEDISPFPVVHVGGGHDHIYPPLKALDHYLHKTGSSKKITILNIDPHTDTRTDSIHHSGTPFRQFDQQAMSEFQLIQIGIKKSANAKANFTPLEKGQMNILEHHEIDLTKPLTQQKFWKQIENAFSPEHIVFLSIDCDVLDNSYMEAVSAPSAFGFDKNFMQLLMDFFKQLNNTKLIGFYEYNPMYDTLSGRGARFIAHCLYEILLRN